MQETEETQVHPGVGKIPGGGHGKPLRYSCLENPMDGGAWRATVHRVTKSQTRLRQLRMHACTLSWPFSCQQASTEHRRFAGHCTFGDVLVTNDHINPQLSNARAISLS